MNNPHSSEIFHEYERIRSEISKSAEIQIMRMRLLIASKIAIASVGIFVLIGGGSGKQMLDTLIGVGVIWTVICFRYWPRWKAGYLANKAANWPVECSFLLDVATAAGIPAKKARHYLPANRSQANFAHVYMMLWLEQPKAFK